MPSEQPRCRTCPSWNRLTNDAGECRKSHPICHPEAAHYAGFANDMYGIWPQVNEDDWCGEHPSIDRSCHDD